MQLILFIASFVIILFALCSFIPYIGIIAILITLLLGLCVGALGIATKMRFVWISSLLSLIAALVALPFQLIYVVHGAIRLGETLIERGQVTWAHRINPYIVNLADRLNPEIAQNAEHYRYIIERVYDAKNIALVEGASEEEAQKKALDTFNELIQLLGKPSEAPKNEN